MNTFRSISVVFYFAKAFGLLPIAYVKNKVSPHMPRHQNDYDACFKICKIGIICYIIQLILQGWTCYTVISYLYHTASSRSEVLCSQGNFCSTSGLLFSHVITAALLIAITPYRCSNTISCFNLSIQLNKNNSIKFIPITLFTIGVLLKTITNCIGFPIGRPELFYPYILAHFGPIIIIITITSLCTVAEDAYDDINAQLAELSTKRLKNKDLDKLATLMKLHWMVGDYVEDVSKCFSIDILLVMIHIYIQLVLFLYLVLWAMFAQNIFSGALWPSVVGLVEVAIIFSKLIYFCYKCDRVVRKANAAMFYIQKLSAKFHYDTNSVQTIKIFTMRMDCRDVQITAFDFFPINLALLIKITCAVLTYFLVLIQFQVDGNPTDATVTVAPCQSWPCLDGPSRS